MQIQVSQPRTALLKTGERPVLSPPSPPAPRQDPMWSGHSCPLPLTLTLSSGPTLLRYLHFAKLSDKNRLRDSHADQSTRKPTYRSTDSRSSKGRHNRPGGDEWPESRNR
jgi:hypothetical protein